MATSQGIARDIISPLVKRLDSVSRLHTGSGADSAAISKIVGEIKEYLRSLRKDLELGGKMESRVGKEFGSVARHVDEMLENAAASDSERNARLRSNLEKINDEIRSISIPDAQDSVGLRTEWNAQESNAMSHLGLVIENLDARLKRCLLCLAVFPEDAMIEKRLLIHWWIGESTVESVDDGKKCFAELSARGLITPIKEATHCQTAHSCKVHPWIRTLLVSVAAGNGFLQFDSDGAPSANYSRSRRVFLREGRSLAGPSDQNGKKKEAEEEDRTLTLYNIDAKYVEFEKGWFAGKKELGALQLGQWQRSQDRTIEIVGKYSLKDLDLGACKKLRYLSLRGMSRVESLPDSIGDLRNLVVLDLRKCHNLGTLTPYVGFVENLEYLDVSDCYLLDQLPKSLSRLDKLQVLKGFVVADATAKDPCRLRDLESLTGLRKLSISAYQESDGFGLQHLDRLDSQSY